MTPEWQPSHRRSEETGKVKDHFNEMPVVDHSAEPEAIAPERDYTPEAIARTFLELINVPVKRLAVHVAALRRIFRADKRPVRVIAKELGVSHSTLLAAEKAIRAKFPKAKKPILQR
jgi:hypothetical protein